MLTIRDIMTTAVQAVAPDASLRTAMELLTSHHIGGLPVVEGDRVIGVISASDILAFVTAAPPAAPPEPAAALDDDGLLAGDVDDDAGDEPSARWLVQLWEDAGAAEDARAVDLADRFADLPPDPDLLGAHTVREAMTRGVYALPPTAPAAEAAECMRAAEVHRLLVMEEGRLLGIVTAMDVVRAVARGQVAGRTFAYE